MNKGVVGKNQAVHLRGLLVLKARLGFSSWTRCQSANILYTGYPLLMRGVGAEGKTSPERNDSLPAAE